MERKEKLAKLSYPIHFRCFAVSTKHRDVDRREPQVEHIAHYAVNIGRDVSSAPATLYQPSTPKDTRKQSRAPYTDARRARLNVVQRMERPLLLSWVASTSTVNLSNPFLPLLLSGRGERKTFLPFFHPKLLRVRFFFFLVIPISLKAHTSPVDFQRRFKNLCKFYEATPYRFFFQFY